MNSAQRMERMIGDLLDLTRPRLGGSLPLKRRPADLQQVCEEAMMEIRASHPDAMLQLQANGDMPGDWDIDRLTQAFQIWSETRSSMAAERPSRSRPRNTVPQ